MNVIEPDSMRYPGAAPDAFAQAVSSYFRAIGQETRLRMLSCLGDGDATVGELARRLQVSQQTAAKHLQTLYVFGLLDRRFLRGRFVYSLADPKVLALVHEVADRVLARHDRLQPTM